MNDNGNGRRLISRETKFVNARKTMDVDCHPELDGYIRLRALGYGDSRQLTNDIVAILSLMIIDDNGERVYTTEEDLKNLADMPPKLMERIAEAAFTINGISKEAVEEAKKNSLASRTDASVSA